MNSFVTRAAVCHAFGEPHLVEEVLLRAPLVDEVLVKVGACAICHSDISYAAGAWGGALPAVYGHEAAGTVVEVGSGVERVRTGDRVVVTLVRSCGTCPSCTRGRPALCVDETRVASPLSLPDGRPVAQGLNTAAFAEHVVVHASQVVPIPPEVPLEAASLLGCGVLTGIGAAVHTASVAEGDTVVVIGAGGIGLNCIQGARLAGAGAIVAVDPVEAKHAAAMALGATQAVDPAVAADRVREATGGFGADTVLVATGARAALESGLDLLSRGGSLVIVGMPANGVKLELDPGDLAHHGRRVLGSKLGSARPDLDIPWLLDLYAEGRLALDELISGRYPLEELDEAIAAVVRGDALRNVIAFDGG
jgi:Zn-dependent alcohol dehydrogenase